MKSYTLYLDESETGNVNPATQNKENLHFVISGIIVEDSYHETALKPEVDKIKCMIWNHDGGDPDYKTKILHELEMSRAITKKFKQLKFEYNKVFKNIAVYNNTYDALGRLFETADIFILSACIDEDTIYRYYPMKDINDRLSIAMNVIIENFCHFLARNNATGKICYESMPDNQNAKIKKRYNIISCNGTMFYAAKTINKHIKGIEFRDKKENIAGLQLADFVPNAIGRHILCKTYNDKKQRNLAFPIIEKKLYDGAVGNKVRFGSKIIP